MNREILARMCDEGEVDHYVALGTRIKIRRIYRSEIERLRSLMERQRVTE